MTNAQAIVSNPMDRLNIFGRPISIFGVPVERDTIFTDHKGNYKIRVEKRQRKLIIKTTFIKFFLHQNERILCLTTGYSPISVLEQVLTGPAFLYFKRAIFVFTEKRILQILTRPDNASHSAIAQIMYSDCSQINLKGRSLIIEYKNGREEHFHYMGRKEKRKLKKLLESIALAPKEAGRLNQRVYLCPSCTNVLDTGKPVCPTCRMAFKSGLKAKLRSLLIPGGGYLYSRHTLPGIAIGLLETVLLSYLFFNLAALNARIPVNFGMMTLFGAIYIIEKFITAFHSQQLTQAFIPEEKDYAMRKI